MHSESAFLQVLFADHRQEHSPGSPSRLYVPPTSTAVPHTYCSDGTTASKRDLDDIFLALRNTDQLPFTDRMRRMSAEINLPARRRSGNSDPRTKMLTDDAVQSDTPALTGEGRGTSCQPVRSHSPILRMLAASGLDPSVSPTHTLTPDRTLNPYKNVVTCFI